MAEGLLEKTRRLNRILQSSGKDPVAFSDVSDILSEILKSNVYVISRKGKLLGYSLVKGYKCDLLKANVIKTHKFPPEYNRKLLVSNETQANIDDQLGCDLDEEADCTYQDKVTTIVPINGGGARLGTLLFTRFGGSFTDDDLVLAEYSATVVGMEIMRSKTEEIEEEARNKAVVQLAIGTLSFSELQAVGYIFEELEGNEGLLVASKIADRVGITRSVIVNALRKLESAGVIESRSLGMKGTHIRILNDKLLEELDKAK